MNTIKKITFILSLALLLHLGTVSSYAQSAYCQSVCTPGNGSGTVAPGGTCSTPNECSGAAPVCAIGGISGIGSCLTQQGCLQGCTLDEQNGGVLPRSAAENYIKGTRSQSSATSGQKGITQITTEAFGEMALASDGGVASITNYMASMYLNQPGSLNTYVADLKKNIGVPGTKDAYAQGAGFVSIQPVLELWKMMRNVALGGFVIVFTVIGIMIMLRSKIDPRTVITIQQAIPRTVIALLLVIFSYAIIGLMIDLTSVLTRLGATMLQAAGYIASDGLGTSIDPLKLDDLLKSNIFANFWPMYNMSAVVTGIGSLPSNALDPIQFILKAMQFTGTDVAGGLTGAVLAIALFIAVIRTFFMLLEAYLKVTLSIILSPLQFLAFAIPGQGKGFGDWARGILANLLIFPATFFMLAFAAIFYADGTVGNGVWYANTNPITGQANQWGVAVQTFNTGTAYWAPAGLGDWGPAVGPLLALAILLTIPKVGATVREVVNPAQKPGAAEGEAAKGIQAAAGRIPVLGSFTKM